MSGPEPYFTDDLVTLHLGDCLDVLAGLPDSSVDSVVTDPPYGLEFMGREWDTFKPPNARIRTRSDGRTNPAEGKSVTRTPESYAAGKPFQAWCEAWACECLRVLKPGGYMLAFGGTRTWHRLACAVEDAGFEIRDSVAELTGQDAPALMWVYAAGFPKSADAGRAIDMKVCPLPGRHFMRQVPPSPKDGDHVCPESEKGEPWRGWGTALKPSWEPIVVGRKALAGTLAGNLLEHGTGALNIDGCRVEGAADNARANKGGYLGYNGGERPDKAYTGDAGRWPPNVLLAHSADCKLRGTRLVRSDGHHPAARGASGYKGGLSGQAGLAERKSGTEAVEAWDCDPGCPVAELDRQSGVLTSGDPAVRRLSGAEANGNTSAAFGVESRPAGARMVGYGDTGGASRFFPAFRWQAKAPASERPRLDDGTAHPTVKPLGLIRWAARLCTPPGGTVLDLFGGSGTTGEACIIEGFNCVLIEKDPAHAELIKARLSKPIQPLLFGDGAA